MGKMKQRFHFAHLLPAFVLLLALMLVLSAECFAMDYELDGCKLTVKDIAPGTEQIIAAVYDGHGKMLKRYTAGVGAENTVEIELLPGETVGYVKLFSLDPDLAPTAPAKTLPLPVSRLWMAQKLCELWDLDTAEYAPARFADTTQLSGAEQQEITAVCRNNFMAAIDQNHFGPQETVTNAQAAVILYRAILSPAPTTTQSPYQDVPTDMWYSNAVIYLNEKGVIPQTARFYPDAEATVTDLNDWMAKLVPLKNTLFGQYSVSNLRFTEHDDGVFLSWDGAKDNSARYVVLARNAAGKWQEWCSLDATSAILTLQAGEYSAFRVDIRGRSNLLSYAKAAAPLSLSVKDGGTDPASGVEFSLVLKGEVTEGGTSVKEYYHQVTGLGDYVGAMRCLTDKDGLAYEDFSFTGNRNSGFDYVYRDVRNIIPGSTCTILGMNDYQLDGTGTKASYTVTKVYEKPVTLSQYQVSNVRFDVINGLPELAWDCSGTQGIQFQVLSTIQGDPNPTMIAGTGGSNHILLTLPPLNQSMTLQGFEVRAIPFGETTPLATAANPDLSFTTTEGTNTSGAVPTVGFAAIQGIQGDYNILVNGAAGYETCQMFFASNPAQGSPWGEWGTFLRLNNGSVQHRISDVSNIAQLSYRLFGNKGYSLSADKKTLRYESVLLIDWTSCDPNANPGTNYQISNIRFEKENDYVVLTWDCSYYTGVRFEIYATRDGESQQRRVMGTNNANALFPLGEGAVGTFRGIEVRAYRESDMTLLASADNPDLSYTCNRVPNSAGAVPSVTIQNLSGGGADDYSVKLSGMTGYLNGQIRFTLDPNQGNGWGNMNTLTNGSAELRFIGVPQMQQSYYQVYGGQNYVLSADGKSLSYDAAVLTDWTQSTVS